MIMRNPAQGVSRPSVAGPALRERRALTETEITKLLHAAEGTQFDVAIRLALATGMRQSELLGLRWSVVDLNRQRLLVDQTIQHVGGEFRALPPKTRNSGRVIDPPRRR
jgi:integrase